MSSPVTRTISRALMLFACMYYADAVVAAPGDLDATYGQHGRTIITSPTAGVALRASKIIQQADGKAVAVGYTEQPIGTAKDFVVMRLNSNGVLDSTFDGDGIAIVDIDSGSDTAVSVVQQSDGKLVVMGNTVAPTFPFGTCTSTCTVAVRFDANGALDPTFGNGGKVILTTASAPSGLANDVVMQGNNIVLGRTLSNVAFSFLRLMSNGAVDTTFGSAGSATINTGSAVKMERMITQADGKILAVGGYFFPNWPGQLSAARINANGTFDTSLNGTGLLTQSCGVGPCHFSGVAQQADGKLVLIGNTSVPITGSTSLQQVTAFVERRNLDGSLDTTFGQSGKLTALFANAYGVPVYSGEFVSGIAVGADGSITLVGRKSVEIFDSAVMRLTAAGAIDATFGSQGYRMIPPTLVQGSNDYGLGWFGLQLLSDGKLLILGTGSSSSGTDSVVGIARLSSSAPDAGMFSIASSIASWGGTVMESSGAATVVVRRMGGATGAVSVAYSTANGTAIAGADFVATTGTLSWSDGDILPRFITVPIISDSIAESTDEAFQVVLSNPVGGAELAYDRVFISIARDDVAPLNAISISQAPVNVSEGAGSINLTVTRTGTASAVVNYYSAPATATPAAQLVTDFSAATGMLVWASGDTSPRTITIPITNDGVFEQSESFNVVLIQPNGATYGGHLATVTIVDDDTAPAVSISPTASVSEGQTSVTINVTRSGATATTVAVNYATSNGTATAGADYAATSGTLTWLPSDPDTKTIIVPLSGDTLVEGDEVFTLALSNPVGGASLAASMSTVTIVDDDRASAPPPASEGGGGNIGEPSLVILLLLALASLIRRRVPIHCRLGP